MSKSSEFDNAFQVNGPYETWVFGHGAPYSRAADNAIYGLVGMAEFTKPTTLSTLSSNVTIGDHRINMGEGEAFLSPAIATDPKQLKSAFWPIIVANKAEKKASLKTQQKSKNNAALRFHYPILAQKINKMFDPGSAMMTRPALKNKLKDKKLIIIGVIDDGLPFAHDHFCNREGHSRIEHFWLQAAQGQKGMAAIPYGREFNRDQIDGFRAKHRLPSGRIDEDGLYADPAIGAITDGPDIGRNIFQNYTHGAHVMDTAAGFSADDLGSENADQIRIIGVQLPRTSLEDTSGFGKDAFILSAVHYVLGRAKLTAEAYGAEDVSVLINISLGISGGPKNGNHQLERAIDEAVAQFSAKPLGDVKVYLAAGNNFDSQLYGEKKLPKRGKSFELPWRIQPNDRTSSYLEVWLDGSEGETLKSLSKQLAFKIRAPNGTRIKLKKKVSSAKNAEMHIQALKRPCDGAIVGQFSLDKYRGDLWRMMLILAPTEHEEGPERAAAPTAEAGIWNIRIKRHRRAKKTAMHKQKIRCAIQRDEDPAGTNNGGRQSIFDFADYKPYDAKGRRLAQPHSFITGFGSINGWATHGAKQSAKHRLSIAGFTAKHTLDSDAASGVSIQVEEPATYSGAQAMDRHPVDGAAIANRSVLLAGVRGAGTRSGATTVLVGTSAAAPCFVRSVVLRKLGVIDGSLTKPSQNPRLGKVTTFTRIPQ